jgi:hypothetical protein
VFWSNKDIIKSSGYKAFLEITLKPQFVPIGGIHSDRKKRRSFVALLFAAGDLWR